MSWVRNPTDHATSVFGPAAAPVVWTNLDISAVTGARTVFVVLKFEDTVGANTALAVRPDGSADEYYDATVGPHGSTRAYIDATPESCLLAVKTSNLGIIEWRASAASTIQVWVLGYCVITDDSTNLFTGTLPTTWTAVDVGSITSQREMLVAAKWHRTGGTANNFAMRPGDDADDYLVTSPEVGGPNMGGRGGVSIYSTVLAKTDALGQFDIEAESVAPAGVLDMAAYCPIEVPDAGDEVVFAAGAPPVVWTLLGLASAGVPVASSSLVVLKVHHAVGAGLRTIAVRDAADPGDYLSMIATAPKGCACCELESDQTAILVVPTANGSIDWIASAAGINIDIEVLGWVPAPGTPTVSAEKPDAINYESNPEIRAVISDDDGIDTSTISLTATDPLGVVTTIITGGAVQTGWTGSIIVTAPGDREITIIVKGTEDEPLANGRNWLFSMGATSYGGGTL